MQEDFNVKTKTTIPPELNRKVSAATDFGAYIPYGFTPKIYTERNGIKKAANAAGMSILILLAASFIGSLIYIMFSLNRNTSQGVYEIAENPAFLQAFQILMSLLTFTLPFIFVYKLHGYRISDLVSYKKTRKGTALPLFFFGVAFCAFSNIASSYATAIFEAFGIDYSVGDYELPQGVFGFMLTFLSTAVVPALVEEFACRGLVLGTLRKYGDGFAVVSSSIVFAIIHGNFEQMPFAFMVGLFLGYSVVKTNSLRVAIAVHFFNNFISVFFSYFLTDISTEIQNIIYVIFLLLSLTLGMFFLKAVNGKTELFKFENAKTECTEKQKYKWFFSSAAIIVFISICLLESLMFF